MTYEKWIVAWDPSGRLMDGTVVAGAAAQQALAGGCAMLPVEEGDLKLHGMGGYVKRQWGDGLDYSGSIAQGKRDAKLAIWIPPDRTMLHWCARVVQAAIEFREQPAVRGQLILTCDSSQAGCVTVGLGLEEAPKRFEEEQPHKAGGFVIGGRAKITSSPWQAFVGLCLHGQAENALVRWFAATLTR